MHALPFKIARDNASIDLSANIGLPAILLHNHVIGSMTSAACHDINLAASASVAGFGETARCDRSLLSQVSESVA